ncbi:MAG: porin [Pseudomonadota bacterium]
MKKALISAAFAASTVALAGPTLAADNIKLQLGGFYTGVAGWVDDDNEDSDRQHAFGSDAEVHVFGSTILDNGLEIGFGTSGKLSAGAGDDLTGRQWAAGRVSGNLIGGQRSTGGGSDNAFIEKSYIYAISGFGKLVFGREDGAADMLAITSPNIFSAIGINDWEADITDLIDVHTVNDFSGVSTKVTYLTPIFAGLQIGFSYTPDTDPCGSDFCARTQSAIPPGAVGFGGLAAESNWEEILEIALYYEQLLGDVTVGLAGSYVTADEQSGLVSVLFDDYEAYAVGVNLAYGGFTIGGSLRSTNGGYDDRDSDGYLAYDAGISYETGPWGFMVGYGNADAGHDAADSGDATLYRQTEAYQTGVTYMFGPGITVGAAAQYVESEKPDTIGGDEEATAIVFESAIQF